MKEKNRRVKEVPLAIRAEEALRRAVAGAIADHRLKGRSIAVWRDGKVTRIPSDQIVVREVAARYSAS
jgi:hypothetical protein